MKNITTKSLLLTSVLFLLFVGCEDEFVSKKEKESIALERGSIDDPSGERVILGKKMENAYSVSTMQSAFDYYNNLYPNSQYQGRIVEPNFKYIKIEPATEQDLVALEKIDSEREDVFLSNYPLDYEVLQEGSEYIDSTYIGKEEFKPTYTVIPIDETLDIPYTVIEKLYEPTDEEFDIETIALAMADWQDDLIADFDQEVTIDNVQDFIEAPNTSSSSRLFGRKFRPEGKIRMYIYDTNEDEGLMNAKIRTGRSFWWRTTYTDEEGYFKATKRYRGKVRIRSAWRNNTATLRMAWYEIIGVQVSDHVMTETRGNNNRTYIIKCVGEDERLWCKGAVHNGIHKYNKYSDINNINKVVGANIWVWKTGPEGCSTPMFHKMQTLPIVAMYSGTGEGTILAEFSSDILLGAVQLLSIPFGHLMPDQIYTNINKRGVRSLGIDKSNRAVEQLVFHESGHFSHAIHAGVNLYGKVVSTELENSISGGDPYLDGTEPSMGQGQLISLAEGWATFIENKCISYYYGVTYDNDYRYNMPQYMENFTMYSTPFNLGGRDDNSSWFLSGLLWDISDNSTSENLSARRDGSSGIWLNGITDNLFINDNLSFIFNNLDGYVLNANNLKQKLISNYPSESTQINQLFQSYGY